MITKGKYNKKGFSTSVANDSFVFNLGRLWQEVISNHWDNVIYLYKFIKEVSSPTIRKRYSKELKNLRFAIDKQSHEDIDKALMSILKW